MQKDFAMFTDAGNAAVAAIVEDAADRYTSLEDAWERCYTELEKLEKLEVFAEATDTAVREEVYAALQAAYLEPVLYSVRA
tara:strand:- start:51 stop:293 length:243 start_codon:yes stop_codon:yes gene_type:complete